MKNSNICNCGWKIFSLYVKIAKIINLNGHSYPVEHIHDYVNIGVKVDGAFTIGLLNDYHYCADTESDELLLSMLFHQFEEVRNDKTIGIILKV